jgi:hypothetical protein
MAYTMRAHSHPDLKRDELSPCAYKLPPAEPTQCAVVDPLLGASSNAADAREHSSEAQLAELLNQEAGQAGVYELKVPNAGIDVYSHTAAGKQVTTQKLQVLLQSHNPEQYCRKATKARQDKLQQTHHRFQIGSTWKFTAAKLFDEKPTFVQIACRITIDLRKTKATAMLQSATFPKTPAPATTIADVLQLKQTQRFDLMAIPAMILAERRSGGGQNIADVRLIDGSLDPRNNAPEQVHATLPITLFFKSEDAFLSFKNQVGRSPMLFMSISG